MLTRQTKKASTTCCVARYEAKRRSWSRIWILPCTLTTASASIVRFISYQRSLITRSTTTGY